jgi:NADH:ubiquinone oxidoreductase subunit D
MIVMDLDKILQFLLVLSLYCVKIEIFKAFLYPFQNQEREEIQSEVLIFTV